MTIPGRILAGAMALGIFYAAACSDEFLCNGSSSCGGSVEASSRVAGPADRSRISPMYESCVADCYIEGDNIRDEINNSLSRTGLYHEMNDHTVNQIVMETEEDCLRECGKKTP